MATSRIAGSSPHPVDWGQRMSMARRSMAGSRVDSFGL